MTGPLQAGDRVRLIFTDDQFTRLRPGDEGTVTRCDRTGTQVKWDSGSTLTMLHDIDRIETV